MGVLRLQLSNRLLVQKRVVLIDPIHTGQVTDVEEVHTGSRQRVHRIVIVQKRLLFPMPLRFRRKHANVIDPVSARFKSNDLDLSIIAFTQLEGERFVVRNKVRRRRYIPNDICVDASHVCQRVLLNLIFIGVSCEYVVERELTLDALSLEILGKLDRYTVRE